MKVRCCKNAQAFVVFRWISMQESSQLARHKSNQLWSEIPHLSKRLTRKKHWRISLKFSCQSTMHSHQLGKCACLLFPTSAFPWLTFQLISHVHGFLEEIGQGIQHCASRVEDLVWFVQLCNEMRDVTGEVSRLHQGVSDSSNWRLTPVFRVLASLIFQGHIMVFFQSTTWWQLQTCLRQWLKK